VTRPEISIQRGKIRHHYSAERVEMNVANQFKQVAVFLAEYRFKSILKGIARTLVAVVLVAPITAQNWRHELG
jgi:hypothetical protein